MKMILGEALQSKAAYGFLLMEYAISNLYVDEPFGNISEVIPSRMLSALLKN